MALSGGSIRTFPLDPRGSRRVRFQASTSALDEPVGDGHSLDRGRSQSLRLSRGHGNITSKMAFRSPFSGFLRRHSDRRLSGYAERVRQRVGRKQQPEAETAVPNAPPTDLSDTDRAPADAPPAEELGVRRAVLAVCAVGGVLVLALLLLVAGPVSNVRLALERAGEQVAQHQRTTFLVLGTDEHNGTKGRSDAIMLARVDIERRKVRCLSLPRDSYVRVPWKQGLHTKLNHAYVLGGPSLSRQTVETYTGVHVDAVVVVNYELFERVVDLVGGVEVNVEHRMDYDDNADGLHIHLAPGLQTLDGAAAIGFVRFRHDKEGDFARMRRQQQFAKAMLERMKRPTSLALLGFNVKSLYAYCKTDFPLESAMGMLYNLRDVKARDVEVRSVPSQSTRLYDELQKAPSSFMVSEVSAVQASCDWLMDREAAPSGIAMSDASSGPVLGNDPGPESRGRGRMRETQR